jgi:hypothetical protein
MIPQNLESLHNEEERIRAETYALITSDTALSDHLGLLHDAMDMINMLSVHHQSASDDQLTIQMLGIRLFNTAAASTKLALSGYYQTAIHLARDLQEITYLLDYFHHNPSMIAVWKSADHKTRTRQFGPTAIRKALEQLNPKGKLPREQIYRTFSEFAAHATYKGFQLLAPDGLVKWGPFFDRKGLEAWLGELSRWLTYGAIIFNIHFGNTAEEVMQAQLEYLDRFDQWAKKYPTNN